jgi:hypothetical protein
LPTDRAALLAELDQTAVGVEIREMDAEGHHGGMNYRCVVVAVVRRRRRRCRSPGQFPAVAVTGAASARWAE